MDNSYITKKELDESLGTAFDKFAIVVNHGFEEQNKVLRKEIKESANSLENKLREEIKETEDKLRTEFIEGNEKVMAELKTIRQEQTVNIGAHNRMQGTLDEDKET